MGKIAFTGPSRVVLVSLTVLALVAALVAGGIWVRGGASDATAADTGSVPAAGTSAAAGAPAIPAIRNVVLVLADDLDTATFDAVPRLHALREQGLSLTNLVVTESLCCPSRASILRSQYVHNHGVTTNLLSSGGGWATFAQKGEEADCLPTWLDAAGVQTAFLGKYLNGYGEDGDPTAIPPGWDYWWTPTTKSGMYRGYGYTVNENRALRTYAMGEDDFLPDVLTERSVDVLRTATSPFYVQINTTSPHDPAPVATRHTGSNADVEVPRTAAFDAVGTDPAPWRARFKPMTDTRIRKYDRLYRQRAQSAESVADTVDAVLATLRETGALDETLVVVTSDNGFHAGQRRLPKGKRTPYLEDTVVPAVVIGPGVAPGSVSSAVTSTVDLGPTFADLLGATTPAFADGRSLVPLLRQNETTQSTTWRTGVLTESKGDFAFNDPDYQAFKPPKYQALRTERWLYVEYEDGSRELFDRQADPLELDNVLATTPLPVVAELSTRLSLLSQCAGEGCRTADTWTSGTTGDRPGTTSPST